MRAVLGLRRWRHNPLRRPTDLAEAWVALVALLLLLLAAPAAGWAVGAATGASLQQSAELHSARHHLTTAHVIGPVEGEAPAGDPDAALTRQVRPMVKAYWATPGGDRVTGALPAARADSWQPGDTFALWTDGRGRPVGRPMSPDDAREQAVLAGIGTALLAAGLVEGARRLTVWRMVRRRYAWLDREWAGTGPDWGRTGAGS
ncbi:hypothetical protein C6N75_28805 [Streptomyces solincola]|uniref:Uncharacterized protein n=1 Tax=Streptomyces solincola TaxID=2100817 RepID=A0A2S9PN53_9ACTN|nr:hypothetical protein [Streptomyces solincola]PRH75845.1 hypothetical protein C6N75_28805 [Streptomyces solincola]